MSQGDAKRSSNALLWIAVLGAFAVLLLVRTGIRRSGDASAIGLPLPALELQGGITDTRASIGLDDLKGKATILNFWGIWCPYCLVELPHIAKLGDEFASDPDFQLLTVTCGSPGQSEAVEVLKRDTLRFLSAKKLDIPVYTDIGAATRRSINDVLGDRFAYPTTLLIDEKAVIRGVWIGYAAGMENEMRDAVQRVLRSES